MDYGQVIRQAWTLTWRYRFLWLLAFFAGGAVGISGNNPAQYRFGGGNGPQADGLPPGWRQTGEAIGTGVVNNIGIIALLAGLAVLLALVFISLAFITQGSMARATADLARGRGTSLGEAWRTGLHLAWRYVGLWLLLIAAVIVTAAVLGALVAAMVLGISAAAEGGPRLGTIAAAVIIGLPLVFAVIVAAIAVSIIVAFAQRAVAVEDVGPVAALQSGWRLFRGHIGDSLLAWLINIGLGIGAGLALAIVLGAIAVVVGGIGLALWSVLGWHVLTLIYSILGGLAFVAALVVVIGIANTFFWHYWTLVYLRLTQPPTPPVPVAPAA